MMDRTGWGFTDNYLQQTDCSGHMRSYQSVNLLTIKVPDTQSYLKTAIHGFLTSMGQIRRFVCMTDRTG